MPQEPAHWRSVNVTMADISTASSVWVVSPCDGLIKSWYVTTNAAITAADCNMSLKIATVAVTGSALVVASSGAAAGVVTSANPTALNYVSKGQAIEVVSGGESSTTAIGTITIMIANPN